MDLQQEIDTLDSRLAKYGHPFFNDLAGFQDELRTKDVSDHRDCWVCFDTGLPVVSVDVQKDFESLGISLDGTQPRIDLCSHSCMYRYMRSFNRAIAKRSRR